jgi:NADPH-dependent glutamate synthase beta subunit-like oxidoreductase/Pyruvate/2-oxoacid:ferredoxin oxidoreductase delta subunit
MTGLDHSDQYPEIPISLWDGAGPLRTGEWRSMRPVFWERGAPCEAACPAGVPIPRWLDHLGAGEPAAAMDAFTSFNPFPRITGRVCPHPCQGACNRVGYDEAVSIRAVERHLGDVYGSLPHSPPGADTGARVAVVGAGPAGLAGAYYLRRAGHRVTVYEKRAHPGGLLRYGIPQFRLPAAVVDDEVGRLEDVGVEFRTGVSFGADVALADLENEYEAVLVATGAWVERGMGMTGEDLLLSGLSLLEQASSGSAARPGEKCAVIGGGNTALDAARVLRRMGSEVTVLYRRRGADMPALAEERAAAEAEGIRFEFLALPRMAAVAAGGLRLTVEKMAPGPADSSGRPSPQPTGEKIEMAFDTVIRAVGEGPDLEPFPTSMRDGRAGWLRVGPDGSTAHRKVFAAGDLKTGPATVAAAIAGGRLAAGAVNAALAGEPATPASADGGGGGAVTREEVNLSYFPRSTAVRERSAAVEVDGSEERLTISSMDALIEIGRCLSCGHCNACGTCFVFCPDSAITWERGPVIDLDFCKGCGICTVECPGHALGFVRESSFG